MDTVRILADGLRFPEGPAFDQEGKIWCVEQEGESLFYYDKASHTGRVYTGGKPNGLVYNQGCLWFCDSGQNSVRRLDLATETVDTVINQLSGQPLNKPNDLIFDHRGNLIITCPGPPDTDDEQGYVVVYSADGAVEIIAEGLLYPNGLAFLPDEDTLLIAETHQQRIWSGYWDADALSWENIRVWTEVIKVSVGASIPGPDGMTIGSDGSVYVAVFGAGIIRVFSAEGKHLRDITLPGQNPSNCIFDPSGELGLIVTETEKGLLLSVTV